MDFLKVLHLGFPSEITNVDYRTGAPPKVDYRTVSSHSWDKSCKTHLPRISKAPGRAESMFSMNEGDYARPVVHMLVNWSYGVALFIRLHHGCVAR